MAPFAPRTPEVPPGIVTTTCDDGTSGESDWNVKVSFPLRTHLPPKAGDSCGVTVLNATGSEKVTEIGAFDATSCAPAAGVEDLTKKPPSETEADPPEPGARLDAFASR